MSPYPVELRESTIQAILSGSMNCSEAAAHFGISYWTARNWVKAAQKAAIIKGSGQSNNKVSMGNKNSSAPLPKGKTLKEMTLAYGYCSGVSFGSSECGAYCRQHGLLVKDVEAFGHWLDERNFVVEDDYTHLANEYRRLKDEKAKGDRELTKELKRKEKALAEAAALLVLSKKAEAIWGEKE